MKLTIKNITVIGLLLITTVAVTQVTRYYRKSGEVSGAQSSPAATEKNIEDTVEVIGTPVNDDPSAEMNRIVSAWYSAEGKNCAGVVKVIDDNGEAERVVEEQPFEYQTIGREYYYRIGSLEMISKKNIMLMVDNDNKKITVNSKPKDQAGKIFDLEAFRKLMLERKANIRVTQLGNEKILTVDSLQDPQVQGYRIHYDAQTGLIHKMLMGMVRLTPLDESAATGNEVAEYYYYIDVDFKTVKPLAMKAKEFKPEIKFITERKGKWELAPAFGTYQLINQH